ncbi:hypothetical protein OROGR_015644 [Orobanche gracilis]
MLFVGVLIVIRLNSVASALIVIRLNSVASALIVIRLNSVASALIVIRLNSVASALIVIRLNSVASALIVIRLNSVASALIVIRLNSVASALIVIRLNPVASALIGRNMFCCSQCCEKGVGHRGMTMATRHSSDTSPELFRVRDVNQWESPPRSMVRRRDREGKGYRTSQNPGPHLDTLADAELDQTLISGVTRATNPSSGHLVRGAEPTKIGDVDTSWIMKGMMSEMTHMTEIVETMQTSMVRNPRQQGSQVPFYKQIGSVSQIVGEISHLRPPTFEGSSEPTDVVHWLEHFDKLFDMVQCPEENKVPIAAYYLCKGAYSWWLSVKPANRDCDWDAFKTLMLERYFPAPLCEAKLSEVLNPESVKDESVMVIAEKFHGLLQFASSVIRTEADKIKYFSKRLNPQLRLQLFNHNCNSLGEFIDKAIGAELLIKELARINPPNCVIRRTKMPVRIGERNVLLTEKSFSGRLHTEKACFSQTSNSIVICFNCDSTGHISTRCTVPSFVYRSCGNRGHLQKYCRNQKSGDKQSGNG